MHDYKPKSGIFSRNQQVIAFGAYGMLDNAEVSVKEIESWRYLR